MNQSSIRISQECNDKASKRDSDKMNLNTIERLFNDLELLDKTRSDNCQLTATGTTSMSKTPPTN